MPLLEEGSEAWRPVHASRVAEDVYEVEVDEEPAGEHWMFPPRSLVRCREHVFEDGHRGLLAFSLADVLTNTDELKY
jgi:hypothetical protein